MTVIAEVTVSTIDLNTLTGERRDLIGSLQRHREFLLQTLEGLDEEQATRRTTVSVLNLAGLVKHVADTEQGWMDFARGVEGAMDGYSGDVDWDAVAAEADDLRSGGTGWEAAGEEAAVEWRHDEFNLVGEETLASVLAHFHEVAAATDAFLAETDLDHTRPLPEAPWFEANTAWSVRRVALHVFAEITQHAGHADMLREHLDGARMMG